MNKFRQAHMPEGWAGDVLLVILSAHWLGPFEDGLATAVMLVPFYFASAWFEAWYAAPNFAGLATTVVRRAIWRANLLNYAMLMAATLIWLVISVVQHSA